MAVSPSRPLPGRGVRGTAGAGGQGPPSPEHGKAISPAAAPSREGGEGLTPGGLGKEGSKRVVVTQSMQSSAGPRGHNVTCLGHTLRVGLLQASLG